MNTATLEVLAYLGLMCALALPLLGILALIERKDKARSKRMVGKGRDRKYAQWRTQRPDLDNLSKSVLDALTDAGSWADDNQVTLLRLAKYNSPTPKLSIFLTKPVLF